RITYMSIVFFMCLFVFSLVNFNDYQNNHTLNDVQVLRKVDSYQEALELEETYDISLVSYSNYGFATYQTHASLLDELILDDFVYSSYAKPIGYENQSVFSDPYANQQYALDLMDVDQAWTMTKGSTSTMIAIIDSGIDTDHDEFVGKLSPLAYNSRTQQVGLTYVQDDTGHGTMVAGVIGAKHENGEGIKGILEEVTLLIIKANNADNPSTPDEDESGLYSDSSIIEAIYYAVDHGADVINLSLGGTYANPLTREAVEYATEMGVVVVGASGNDGNSDLLYPASFSDVISVGSVGETRIISDFSNYNNMVDISAPGEDIVTTYLNNEYRSASGTSFAAPQVTGVIGLLLAHNPNQTPAEIYERITETAVDRGTVGKDNYYGYGIINAYQSLLFSYYIVSFETYGGTSIDPIIVQSNETFTVLNPTKVGHTFQGWYLDSSFTQVFMMGSTMVTSDTLLYAKFIPDVYTITLIGRLGEQQQLEKNYGSIVTEDVFSYEGYTFGGWYYDESLNNPYGTDLITSDLTLFAKFDVTQLTIFYSVDNSIVFSEQLSYGEIPTLYEPNPNQMTIEGWFTDKFFINPYEPNPLYEDVILYGKVDYTQLHVRYYDYDGITVLLYEVVSYGESVTPPNAPVKPNSPSLSFEFIGWSDQSSIVTSNKSIYPLYEVTYHQETVYVLPQIDTIILGDDFIDEGIHLIDENLELEIIGTVDTSTLGKYIIIYKVLYEDEMIDYLIRVVHVIEPTTVVEIHIEPNVTTIFEGDTYVEEGATSNIGEVVITGEVNTNLPGTYEIKYQVTIDNKTTTKVQFVHVIEHQEVSIDQAYIHKEDEVEI
ncbi:MAG: DUF5011 domain-containing protein, partial [Bacillota bacterium]